MENQFLRSESAPEGWAKYQNNILPTPLLLPCCTIDVPLPSQHPNQHMQSKQTNPIGYLMVRTITLKAWSVHLPFNPFMYIVEQTGGTWTPVWKSLKIHISLCYYTITNQLCRSLSRTVHSHRAWMSLTFAHGPF